MRADRLFVEQRAQCLVFDRDDLRDLVRCAKAVEEVQDGHASSTTPVLRAAMTSE